MLEVMTVFVMKDLIQTKPKELIETKKHHLQEQHQKFISPDTPRYIFPSFLETAQTVPQISRTEPKRMHG